MTNIQKIANTETLIILEKLNLLSKIPQKVTDEMRRNKHVDGILYMMII